MLNANTLSATNTLFLPGITTKKKKKMERKPQVNRGDEAYKLLSDIKIPIEKKMISYVIYSENLFSRIVLF